MKRRKKSITLEKFFSKYFPEYSIPGCKNAFDSFCCYLKSKKILNAKKKCITPNTKTIENGYMRKKDSTIVLGKDGCFRDYICELMKDDDLWTWNQALEKKKIKPQHFKNALIKMKLWDDEKHVFKNMAHRYGIEFGLFSSKALNLIAQNSSDLKNIEHNFFIQWVGPFRSLDDCEKWEKENSISDKEYNFYYGMGKVPRAKLPSFYIGKSELKDVCNRMKQETDPISSFRDNASLEIWIGRFSNSNFRSKHKLVEIAEWALIYSFKKRNPLLEKRIINKRKLKEPKEFYSVVNQCFDKTTLDMRKKTEAMKYIPSMIFYYDKNNVRISDSSKTI